MMKAGPRGPRVLSEFTRRRVESYIVNMRRSGLKLDIRKVVDSIKQQYDDTGWLSFKQVDVLRRCCIASNSPYPTGGGSQGPCFGRNAPAGRRSGPVG